MTNSYGVYFQDMLRDCENGLFCGDVQDDTTTHAWIDAKRESPIVAKMVWDLDRHRHQRSGYFNTMVSGLLLTYLGPT